MCVFKCVSTCESACVCSRVCSHVCVHVYVFMCMCSHVCVHVCLHMCVCVYQIWKQESVMADWRKQLLCLFLRTKALGVSLVTILGSPC